MEQIILTFAVSLGIVQNSLLAVFLWKRDKEPHVAKALRPPTLLGGAFGLALGALLCRPWGVTGPILGALSGVFSVWDGQKIILHIYFIIFLKKVFSDAKKSSIIFCIEHSECRTSSEV